MNRLCVPNVPLEVYSFLDLHIHLVFSFLKFTAGKALIKALSKSLVLGWGPFASPGRTTDWGTALKLQQQSWRYDNASLAITLAREFCFRGQTTAPGYCTSRGPLCFRAVKAG